MAAKERRAARKAGTIKDLIKGVQSAQQAFDKVSKLYFQIKQKFSDKNKIDSIMIPLLRVRVTMR